jgi:hypothetical protein
MLSCLSLYLYKNLIDLSLTLAFLFLAFLFYKGINKTRLIKQIELETFSFFELIDAHIHIF